MTTQAQRTLGVYIGRFQPFHNGHYATVKRMLDENTHAVVLVGGYNGSRNASNPFSFKERYDMIEGCFPWEDRKRLNVAGAVDYPKSDKQWAAEVKATVKAIGGKVDTTKLYGCKSDDSSFYLDMFPEWEPHLSDKSEIKVHATNIRTMIRGRYWGNVKHFIPTFVYNYITDLLHNEPDTCHKWLETNQ